MLPSAPLAKKMNRLARYTRISPKAPRAVTDP
jgi:hypothetical protein